MLYELPSLVHMWEWYCVGHVVFGYVKGLSDTRRVLDTQIKASLVVAPSFIEPNLPTYDLSIFLIIS
jgi:hypothetical protein